MHALNTLFLAALVQAAPTQEFKVTVRTKDNSTFIGAVQLPAKLTLTTKFGEIALETRTITQITRAGDLWSVTAGSAPVNGKVSLGELIVITPGGTLKIPEEEILFVTLQPAVAAAPPPVTPAGVSVPGGAKPLFKGFEFRKRYVEGAPSERHADFALLLSGEKHLAVIDRESSEVVFVELASGKTSRVRADAGANHMIERNGKLYVANTDARTLSVIDAAAFKPLRQIQMAESPKWLTAPAFGSHIYVGMIGNSGSKIQRVNAQTDALDEPVDHGSSNQDIVGLISLHMVGVTPDNRFMVTINSMADPTLYELSGASLSFSRRMGEKHWPSFYTDFRAGRSYLGSHVYSTDLQKRLTSITNADILVPHPTKRVLFGRKCSPPQPHRIETNRGTAILVLDEETFASLVEIEVGDRVLALVPTEETLYVVSDSRIYPIELKAHVSAEALSRAKPVRNDVDLAKLAAVGTTTKRSSYNLPRVGGWALLEDHRSLAVAIPEKAELLYIDTMDGAELRRVALDFQPASTAVQGDTLYSIRSNSSVLYALDAATGKTKKEIKVPGDPLVRVACAPKGRVYVSNAKGHVLSIDPASGAAAMTDARGLFLHVDPRGLYVYTGRTSPSDWGVEVEKDKDGTTTWYYDDWGYRSMIRKYAVSGTSLKQVAINDNTAVNGRSMVLSPEGGRIAMVGGGGWRPKRTGGGAGGYMIAIYDTKDISTVLGQVDVGAYPENIAFHPVLEIGATLKTDSEITIFKTKSMATIKRWQVKGAPGSSNSPGWLMFAGRGETLLYCQAAGIQDPNRPGKLFLIPLELTAEDRAALVKAYGKPAAPADPAKAFHDAVEAERKGDKAAAIRLYRQVVQEDPNSDLSKQASRKILSLEEAGGGAAAPASPVVGLLKTANALYDSGESDRALKYYKRIVDEQPNSPEAQEARKRIKEIEKK